METSRRNILRGGLSLAAATTTPEILIAKTRTGYSRAEVDERVKLGKGFVDQGGRLKRDAAIHLAQRAFGDLMQLGVNQREQAFERLAVAISPGQQEFGYLV